MTDAVDAKTDGKAETPASPTTKGHSLTGDLYTFFFNGRASISEALKRSVALATDVPVALLGRSYCGEDSTQWVRLNMEHVLYYSYRNHIPRPLSNGADHDAGWGCMIRTGQMMLCEALRRVVPDATGLHVPAMFRDTPEAPFGLHRMTEVGEQHLVPVGQWFNPTCCALTVQSLVAACPEVAPLLEVVVGRDGSVPRAAIEAAHSRGRQVLLLIPLMVGLERVPPGYDQGVAATFAVPQSLGIVGGRPKHSLYFVGGQKETLFYLDPHIVQPAFLDDTSLHGEAALRGFCSTSDLDPCMLHCYLLPTAGSVADWEAALAADVHPLSEYPMFSVTKARVGPPTNDSIPGAVVDDCAFDSDLDTPLGESPSASRSGASSPQAARSKSSDAMPEQVPSEGGPEAGPEAEPARVPIDLDDL